MPYYRVDRRLFKVGDVISSANEYYDKFKGIAKTVEDTLEVTRPKNQKKLRTECLFVFEDEKCAKKHWSKMVDGKLYEVSIEGAITFHRGDMALMDAMKQLLEAGSDITKLAEDYWREECSAKPEMEILVSSAVVVDVISTSDNERKDHLTKRWRGLA